MPKNLKLVDCFMAILFILMFNLCLTLVRWNKINFVLSILRTSLLPQSQKLEWNLFHFLDHINYET